MANNIVRRTWTDQETKAFLYCFNLRKGEFDNLRKKKYAFQNVLEDLLAMNVMRGPVSAENLENKMKTLLKAYKTGKDNEAKTGSSPSIIPYERELDEIYGDKPLIGCSHIIATIPPSHSHDYHSVPATSSIPSSSSKSFLFSPTPVSNISINNSFSESLPPKPTYRIIPSSSLTKPSSLPTAPKSNTSTSQFSKSSIVTFTPPTKKPFRVLPIIPNRLQINTPNHRKQNVPTTAITFSKITAPTTTQASNTFTCPTSVSPISKTLPSQTITPSTCSSHLPPRSTSSPDTPSSSSNGPLVRRNVPAPERIRKSRKQTLFNQKKELLVFLNEEKNRRHKELLEAITSIKNSS